MKRLKLISLIIASALSCVSSFSQSKQIALRPSAHYWKSAGPRPSVHVSRLSARRKLVSIGDTLYMLDARNRIAWKWTSDGPPFTDFPIIDSTGSIYVVGYDLVWVAIDAGTGQEKWKREGNGRGFYSQIKLYRKDMYAVVTNMSGYRDSLSDKTIEDSLSLCKGNDVMWQSSIPANSRISVSGNKVFVVFRQRNRIVKWPLRIPARFRQPIGRVSGWYPHP
jgi:outer membrane protein assembly factor BamB